VSYWILHIADPHFGQSHFHDVDPDEIARHHAMEIKGMLVGFDRSSFHAIVLSGDLTFRYNIAGFQAAQRFIEYLSDLIPAKALIVVPGNHDVDIGPRPPVGQVSVPLEKHVAEEKYRDFLAQVSTHVGAPNPWLCMVRRFENEGEPGLVVAGINSCRVERYDAQGWGYVGLDQIERIGSQLLNPPHGAPAARDGDLVVAVVHHNLLPVWDMPLHELAKVTGDRKLSFTLDAASLLTALDNLGVAVLLHGHTHVLAPRQVRGYGSEDDEPLKILGAGSFGLFHASCRDHHLQILQVDSNWITSHDVVCGGHIRNAQREWHRKHTKIGIGRRWNRARVKRALAGIRDAASDARWDWEAMHSWSRVRARSDASRWPAVRAGIVDSVRRLPRGTNITEDEVEQAITILLFKSPPAEEHLTGLTLQEYLVQRLRP
jgi:predicted phosphodiesterase